MTTTQTGTRPPLAWPLLLTCVGCVYNGPADPEADDSTRATNDTQRAQDSDDTAAPSVGWTLQKVASGATTDLVPGDVAITNRVDGYTYVLMGDGAGVWYLTNTYIHPAGTWCVGGSGLLCTGGVERVSGLIEPSNNLATMCLDDDAGRLFLVASDDAVVEIADVAPEGDEDTTYQMPTGVLRLEGAPFDTWQHTGPCAWSAQREAIVLTAPDGGVATISAEDGALLASGTLPAAPTRVAPLEDGALVMVDDAAAGALHIVRVDDWTVQSTFETGAPIVDWALDPGAGRVWVAHEDGAVVLDLAASDGAATALAIPGALRFVEADPSTGLGLFVAETEDAWTLYASTTAGELVSVTLDGAPRGLARPSLMGDLTILLEGADGATSFSVFDPVGDHATALPPVLGFLFTSIETPGDLDIDMPCEGADTSSVEALVAQVESNALVLASLDIPIVLGVTYNFVTVTERCGLTEVFDHLAGLGFELGVMVHNRPEYNCVAAPIEGVEAELCGGPSAYACDPATEACTFPGDEGYCALGDWDCYLRFMNEHVAVTDGALPGGGRFIVGADRHNLWSWDWIRAYEEMDRADGSTGYDVSLFAHAWAYTDEVSLDDSRAKNPAPWRPEDRVEAWALGDAETWDQDSAFSDLLYLPGFNTATIKLSEWQQSGVFMVDFLNAGVAVRYDQRDFEALTHILRAAIHHRTAYAPNTFYFHVHDIGMVNLTDADGVERESAALLRDWVSNVAATHAARGELEWSTPAAIRAAYPPR